MASFTFQASRRISVLMVLLIPLFLGFFVQPVVAFLDVPKEHRYYLAIQHLYEKNLIEGYSDQTFHPEGILNRAEALKIVLLSAEHLLQFPAQGHFTDVTQDDWFFPYAETAYQYEIVRGDSGSLVFAPERSVNRAEFIKMLLLAHDVLPSATFYADRYSDVPAGAWFSSYLNYAAELGLLMPDSQNRLLPQNLVTRAEVAQILYLLDVIRHGENPLFLFDHAKRQLAQIEIYMANGRIVSAQMAAQLVIDFTDQILVIQPQDHPAQALLQLGKGYQLVIKAFIEGVNGATPSAQSLAGEAIEAATLAWQYDADIQPLARQLKERANGIIAQTEVVLPQMP